MVESLRENGWETIWKAWGSMNGMMAGSTKEIIKMIKSMDMGFMCGLMVENIWVTGTRGNSMGWESTLLKRRIKLDLGCGKKERGLNGLILRRKLRKFKVERLIIVRCLITQLALMSD